MASFDVVIDVDSLNTGVFSPASVSSSSHVTINGNPVSVEGDSVSTHSRTSPSETHAGATMVSSNQSFVTINGSNVIVDGDAASCDPTHTINASGFVVINT